jgi:hypothetical protein
VGGACRRAGVHPQSPFGRHARGMLGTINPRPIEKTG